MGFLDQEVALQRKQELERQAKIERNRIASEAQTTAQRLLDEDKSHATEYNKAIVTLLDSLPDLNLSEYLGLVAKHTKYSPRLVLYTRLALYDQSTQKRLLEEDSELRDKLSSKGINPWVPISVDGEGGGTYYNPLPTSHPKNMFCEDDISPRKGFFSEPIKEPQGPGIGIHFENPVSHHTQGLGYHTVRSTTTYRDVYIRLIAPAIAIITGSGERIGLTSLEIFDQALERGFRKTHLRRYQSTYFVTPVIGNG